MAGQRTRRVNRNDYRQVGCFWYQVFLTGPRANDASVKRGPRLTALIVALVVAVLSTGFTVLFYSDLAGISPCDGGLAPGGPACSGPPLQVEQEGHEVFANGTYFANFVLSPWGPEVLNSTYLSVTAWTDSGTGVALSNVTLCTTQGTVLANFTSSTGGWTTSQSVVIFEPEILTVSSSTSLVGNYLSVQYSAPPSGGGNAAID